MGAPVLSVLFVYAFFVALMMQGPAPIDGTASTAPTTLRDTLRLSLDLRMKGRFEEAEQMLRSWLVQHPDDRAAQRAVLGILEDSGRVDEFVEESRRYRARFAGFAGDHYGDWCLARGLLFRAAIDPNPSPQRLEEATKIVQMLDADGWAPPDSRGARSILWMQLAFLQGNWSLADSRALEAMRLGTTVGESADLQTMRLDLALRTGRMDEARRMLDECLNTVKSWRGQEVYYQLFPYREAAVWLRLTYYGEKITRDDINAPGALYQTLAADGLKERLALGLVRQGLLRYVELEERQDYATILTETEAFFSQYPPPHAPTCFYGETLYLPVVASAAQLLMGDLCVRLGNTAEARRHYEAGLKAHADDWTLRQRLAKLTRS